MEKQRALISALQSQLSDEERALCDPVIAYLLELGYTPQTHKKNTFAVEFRKNGRIISKMEIGRDPNCLIFFLRFSASGEYSDIFQRAVARRPEAWIKRNQEYVNHKMEDCCRNCKGNPRFYHFYENDGAKIVRCGGYTLPIPDITHHHLPELLRLMKEQDDFFRDILSCTTVMSI